MPKIPNYAKFFSVYLRQEVPDQFIGEAQLNCIFSDCPNPDRHFFADCDTGQWHCKRCDESGNALTLITKIHEQYLHTTTDEQYKFLAKRRGISTSIFKSAGFAYNDDHDFWYVPFYTYKPDLQDFSPFLNNLGYFYPSAIDPKSQFVIHKAPTLPTYLYNPGIHQYAPVSSRNIICEGEWDTLAYYQIYPDTIDLVLGKPGAGFPVAYLETIKETTETVFILDNDDAGRKQQARAIGVLRDKEPKRKISVFDWTLVDTDKWRHTDDKETKDVRDFLTHKNRKDAANDISQAIVPYDVEELPEDATEEVKLSAGYVKDATIFPEIHSFGEYIEETRKVLLLGDTTVNAMGAVLGITTAISIPGEPLWGFLRGQASSGKTTHLESYGGDNQWFDNLSRLSAETLISGWVDENPDSASYLGKLSGKTLFVKDFTPNLTGPIDARIKLFGLLTDIYDGQTKIVFGNRRQEEYHNINFNMVCGVTDIIDSHSAASIGERFLRIDWLGQDHTPRDYLRKAFSTFGHRTENKQRLTELTLGFVKHLRNKEIIPGIEPQYEEPLLDLADFVATLRTKVESNRFEGLVYRPRPELPIRIGMQLAKLFLACRVVTGTSESAFKMTRKVALDTCYGFPLDVVKFILQHPQSTREEISHGIVVHSQRAYRVLADLVTTGVLKSETKRSTRSNGRPIHYFSINPRLLPALQPEKYLDIETTAQQYDRYQRELDISHEQFTTQDRSTKRRSRPTDPPNSVRTRKSGPPKRTRS
jgi:Toprim-like